MITFLSWIGTAFIFLMESLLSWCAVAIPLMIFWGVAWFLAIILYGFWYDWQMSRSGPESKRCGDYDSFCYDILPRGLVVIGFLSLTACFYTPAEIFNAYKGNPKPVEDPWEFVSTELHRVKVTDITHPKHVYVSFEDYTTGNEMEHLYVSKHCSNPAKIGEEYNLQTTVFRLKTDPSTLKYQYPNLSQVFC